MNKWIYIASFVLLLTACKKEEFTVQNLNNNKIEILGHGGMGISDLFPMNSLEAIGNCLNLDADGSEMDVQMTKDSILVAFHDGQLDESTDMSGVVNSLTWNELKAANYTNAPYGNYRVVRLDQIFEAIDFYESRTFTFDIKLYPAEGTDLNDYFNAFAEEIVDFYNAYGLHENVYVESQSPDFLNLIKSKETSILLYYYPQTFDDGYSTALNNGYRGISISTDAISADQVKLAHDQGLYVTIWGVETKKRNVEAIRKNPDMIQTDKIAYLVDLLK